MKDLIVSEAARRCSLRYGNTLPEKIFVVSEFRSIDKLCVLINDAQYEQFISRRLYKHGLYFLSTGTVVHQSHAVRLMGG